MDREQRRFLEKQYETANWPKPAGRTRLRDLRFDGSEIPRWKLERFERDETVTPPLVNSMWRRGDSLRELLSVEIWECASGQAARDQLLETLGNMESPIVKRRAGKDSLGEIAFGLGDTMVVFALANTVVLVRNAGPSAVAVTSAAREIEKQLQQRVKTTTR